MIEAEWVHTISVDLDPNNPKHTRDAQMGKEHAEEEIVEKGILEKIDVLNFSELSKIDRQDIIVDVAEAYAFFWIDKGSYYSFKLIPVGQIRVPNKAMREKMRLCN